MKKQTKNKIVLVAIEKVLNIIRVVMSHKTLVKKRTYIFELNDIIKNKKNVIYWPHNLNANRHTFDINTCKVEDHSALNIAPQQTPPPSPWCTKIVAW